MRFTMPASLYLATAIVYMVASGLHVCYPKNGICFVLPFFVGFAAALICILDMIDDAQSQSKE